MRSDRPDFQSRPATGLGLLTRVSGTTVSFARTTWDRMYKVPGTKSAFRPQAESDVMSTPRAGSGGQQAAACWHCAGPWAGERVPFYRKKMGSSTPGKLRMDRESGVYPKGVPGCKICKVRRPYSATTRMVVENGGQGQKPKL